MTKAERLATHVQKAKQKLADQRQAVVKAEAKAREAVRTETNKRRFHVGCLAEEAGLMLWDDATLRTLFHTLALLHETPDPVAVLEGCLVSPCSVQTSLPSPCGEQNSAIGVSLRETHPTEG